MSSRQSLKKIYGITTSQWGLDPRRFVAAFGRLPGFIRSYFRFRSTYVGRMELYPCLHDALQEGASIGGEYFWQDVYVARKIFEAKPEKHVDVGSRVDGFVAHVASFREIEVFDIRPITIRVPHVTFRQADLMSLDGSKVDYCDSLSCLHALEHFGLGRYGDGINPLGYQVGIRNMSRMLRARGTFYLSVPIGLERVEFNAHRVFHPATILDFAGKNDLALKTLAVYTTKDGLAEVDLAPETISSLGKNRYALGVFTFTRT